MGSWYESGDSAIEDCTSNSSDAKGSPYTVGPAFAQLLGAGRVKRSTNCFLATTP